MRKKNFSIDRNLFPDRGIILLMELLYRLCYQSDYNQVFLICDFSATITKSYMIDI